MAPIMDNKIPLVTLCFTASFFPAPNLWAVKTEKPAVIPWAKPLSKNIIVPVEPTAAKASAPTKRPTMMVSAIL